jgi:hypothetical protein
VETTEVACWNTPPENEFWCDRDESAMNMLSVELFQSYALLKGAHWADCDTCPTCAPSGPPI